MKVYGVDTVELAQLRAAMGGRRDTRRYTVMDTLERDGELTVNRLAALMGCTEKATHRALLRLQKQGVVSVRKEPYYKGGERGVWGLA